MHPRTLHPHATTPTLNLNSKFKTTNGLVEMEVCVLVRGIRTRDMMFEKVSKLKYTKM